MTVRLLVARVGRAHGIRGEVTIQVHTDAPDARFVPGTVLHTATGELTVRSVRDHNGTLLIGFEQILDRNAAEALLEQGATSVTAYITHGVLSGGAVARIAASKLKELVITDSIQPATAVESAHNIRIISIADLMGEAISRTASEESVSSLFD